MSQQKLSAIVFLFAVIGFTLLNIYPYGPEPETHLTTYMVTEPVTLRKRNFNVSPLQARAVYVFDPTTSDLIYAKQSNQTLPLASLTKIMTAIVATEQNNLSFAGRNLWLKNRMLDENLKRMLVSSSNEAAQLIAAFSNRRKTENSTEQFVEAMNIKARELGLAHTQFRNVTGLDINSNVPGAVGSAEDIATLLWYGFDKYPELVLDTQTSQVTVRSATGRAYELYNTNEIVNKLPSVLASKTGLTDLAGGNLALVIDVGINHPIVAVILGSSEKGRFKDMENLVQSTLSFFASDLYTVSLSRR